MRIARILVLAATSLLIGACASSPSRGTAIPGLARPTPNSIVPDLTKVIEEDGSWESYGATAVLDFDKPFWEDAAARPCIYLQPKGISEGVSLIGIVYAKGLEFKDGVIEVDLKGRDVDQASFLGVAFNGVDGKTFEAIYFRPFNFRSTDPERKSHAVQYISWPEHTWEYLRENKTGMYEAAVNPAPLATEWFHARIVISGQTVEVYVNNAKEPSLTVKRLSDRPAGKVGLMADTVSGAFANLVITPTID